MNSHHECEFKFPDESRKILFTMSAARQTNADSMYWLNTSIPLQWQGAMHWKNSIAAQMVEKEHIVVCEMQG